MLRSILIQIAVASAALFLAACYSKATPPANTSFANVSDADNFISSAEQHLETLSTKLNRAQWVQETFITPDTETISAEYNKDYLAAVGEAAKSALAFEKGQLSLETARKIRLLKSMLFMPAPADNAERDELAKIAAAMISESGSAKFCPQTKGNECLSYNDVQKIMTTERNPQKLKETWIGWHSIASSHRQQYARFVELSNKGAHEFGFTDLGAMWRASYDMTPEAFEAESERLWLQIKPLYDSLFEYTRIKLIDKYGSQLVPQRGPIPVHLFGNLFAQDWTGIKDILKPSASGPSNGLAHTLLARKIDGRGMVKYAENFYLSLGFAPLPSPFWDRSLLSKPKDRDVNCGASAWHVDNKRDVRLKMCINVDETDFRTLHHELGHTYYQLAYSDQPFLFKDAANGGFHEALGDAVSLSITPEYLQAIGLGGNLSKESKDIDFLLQRALEEVAFLPFGYLVDQWRWKVFSGKVTPGDYNKVWWELREKYQNVSPPEPRSEKDFDAWAKGHVPGNYPYIHYFVASILKFQFHRALCKEAGITDPLHQASVYNNKKAGEKLWKMLEMGRSKPWPEALKTLTGEDKMDASALLDYFAPLKKWLDEQIASRHK